MVSTSESADFHGRFQDLKNDILHSLERSSLSAAEITPKLNMLKALYTAQSGTLPSYDQRQYGLTLADLEKKVSVVRAKERPRTKFAFAKKASTPNSSISPPTPAITNDSSGPSGSVTKQEKRDSGLSLEPSSELALSTLVDARTFTLSNLDQTYITQEDVPSEAEYTLSISNVSNSIIDLRPGSSSSTSSTARKGKRLMSLHAKGVRRCVIIAGWLEGSALLHDITDSMVILGAHQFRMHTSTRTKGLIHVTSVPVIEHSSELQFGLYPGCIGAEMSGENKVGKMADFDWVREGPSPHWISLSTDQQRDEERLLQEVLVKLGPGVDVIEILSKVLRREA